MIDEQRGMSARGIHMASAGLTEKIAAMIERRYRWHEISFLTCLVILCVFGCAEKTMVKADTSHQALAAQDEWTLLFYHGARRDPETVEDHYNCYRIPTLVNIAEGGLMAIVQGRHGWKEGETGPVLGHQRCGDYGDFDLLYRVWLPDAQGKYEQEADDCTETSSHREDCWSEIKLLCGNEDATLSSPENCGHPAAVFDTLEQVLYVLTTKTYAHVCPDRFLDHCDSNGCSCVVKNEMESHPGEYLGCSCKTQNRNASVDVLLTSQIYVARFNFEEDNFLAYEEFDLIDGVGPNGVYEDAYVDDIVGPGTGIQVSSRGANPGRLVFPARNRNVFSDPPQTGETRVWSSYGIRDGEGQNQAQSITNEPTVVEKNNGWLMRNDRSSIIDDSNQHEPERRVSLQVSGDSQEWTAFEKSELHTGETGCHASLLRYTAGSGMHRLLFSSPSQGKRQNLRIAVSYNEGESWEIEAVLLNPREGDFSTEFCTRYDSLMNLVGGETCYNTDLVRREEAGVPSGLGYSSMARLDYENGERRIPILVELNSFHEQSNQNDTDSEPGYNQWDYVGLLQVSLESIIEKASLPEPLYIAGNGWFGGFETKDGPFYTRSGSNYYAPALEKTERLYIYDTEQHQSFYAVRNAEPGTVGWESEPAPSPAGIVNMIH
ncbi:MAG: sialidase family protein [Myxococcota bacterium]|nr:sialidase family protein [Myxococcota bacterium]